ncbi:hypothetical protein EOA32_00730 [Mesorhizobium sp. M1A.F.Ca.ET.072.01.1.1]|uniref:hypothetical protein n=1 Tax=Mesorhizobium sp. M1A.F.Ca.ET.072.01.1.1 TaxID=2496753 RepID=UPI000FD57FA2|nr:hypothetical protein [Mesorhizobium sp. M1A.F.Ca.ET.072.01.1.1]RUW55576.1 hypothetical protein EOA32_00730 [Mesorhizobium sp. M1A.F.Ca.ET.072.01.1.1]
MANNCTKLRRMLVKHGSYNMTTGETTAKREEWVTRECGVPLFGETERKTGICRACARGWTHPENYPVEAEPQP